MIFAGGVMPKVTLEALDLAALLCSRVCHDVISPVGAIVNGLEVLEDEKDPSMRDFAFDLIAKSSKQASARLQFARLAFGAAGSVGAEIDLRDAEQVARGLFLDNKITIEWAAPALMLPKNKVKLLLNLVMIASSAIPRGGSITVTVTHEAEKTKFVLRAHGQNARVPVHAESLLAADPDNGIVDAHSIQPFYAGMIARASQMSVSIALDGEDVVFTAVSD